MNKREESSAKKARKNSGRAGRKDRKCAPTNLGLLSNKNVRRQVPDHHLDMLWAPNKIGEGAFWR